jgi:putative hydrolase
MVRGMGRKRIQAVRESLTGRFGRGFRRERQQPLRLPDSNDHDVPVSELLDIDREYRSLANSGKLPRVSPRRFNPTQEAWLPILHTVRGERHYTALFSNTTRAHEQDAIRDWVIIYRDDDHNHGRWTVITAHFGRLHGRRIVRGREVECDQYYAELEHDVGLQKQ